MTIFCCQRPMPSMTSGELDTIGASLADSSRRVARSGRQIRLLSATYDDVGRQWVAFFDSEAEESVHAVIALAQLPAVRVSAFTEG
jgi:hypothetical protein